ncbi:MAG: DUF4245 domain-containing protein [Micrococcaceae bacterium]
MPDKELPQEPIKIPSKQADRLNQTVKNMVWAVLITIAVCIPVLALNARKEVSYNPTVDVNAIAQQVQPGASFPLAHPQMPPGWSNNYARFEVGEDQVSSWDVGYITAQKEYIGLVQSSNANETWISQKITEADPTAPREVNGISWKTYEGRKEDSNGKKTIYMVGKKGNISYILDGTADQDEFDQLATAVTS